MLKEEYQAVVFCMSELLTFLVLKETLALPLVLLDLVHFINTDERHHLVL